MKKTILFMAVSCAALAAPAQPELSLLSYRQLFASLAASTGVEPSAELREYERGATFRLLADGDAKKFNATTLLTTVSVAGYFCQEAITSQAALPATQRRLFSSLSFEQGPSAVTHQNQVDTATQLVETFWAREPEPLELQALLDLWQGLQSESGDTPDALREISLGLCTAVGSSLDAIRY